MNRTFYGDCRETLRLLSVLGTKVQCCVTSPPYFGLRDYGHPGQLGLEPTPAEYVAAMVEVFGLVREVLADDGVLWLNLGDSYANTNKGHNSNGFGNLTGSNLKNKALYSQNRSNPLPVGFKPKDLIGIPWRVAFALQEDGWYLRQDIIWHKPNPMPESVTDRCTKAHEYVFLLSKSARYFWDSEAMKEAAAYPGDNRAQRTDTRKEVDSFCKDGGSRKRTGKPTGDTRNKRSVWTIPTKPYRGAHFATFPPALIEPMILAGSRPGDIVMDPFMGSGTTGQVARALGRQWIGCELNREYAPLIEARTTDNHNP